MLNVLVINGSPKGKYSTTLQKKSENLCKCCKPSVVGYLNVEDCFIPRK